ncbi:MAG: hypothetical protein LBD75_01215 [Candidatus Peribacteria bacterium]|jgi:hypothetical protein|nr:hypothetical protein [Candidatus Peribacteria bacterium]
MIEALRSMILHQGKEVAHLLPYELFKTIKALNKAGNLKNYCDKTGTIDFNSIPKKTPSDNV